MKQDLAALKATWALFQQCTGLRVGRGSSTVHRLIADEFFDWESFSSRADFLAKASLYQPYFNLARPNSHKEGRAPWQIIQQLDPRLSLDLCLLPPVFLDYRLDSHAGYDVPRYP